MLEAFFRIVAVFDVNLPYSGTDIKEEIIEDGGVIDDCKIEID